MAFEHIHPDLRYVAHQSRDERLAFMDSPRWIGYDKAERAIQELAQLLNKPKRPRMPNLLLVGEPNNGKTTILHRFFRNYGQAYTDENNDPVRPVLLAEAPPSADEKGLYLSILERFWAPHRPTDPTAKLRYQVIHLCRSCHVSMLAIDEFHSLLAGTAARQREVMNALKLLCNELAIPIVGAGTLDAVRVLHTDPQHASRFDVLRLPLWELDKDFQRLLLGFERILPLQQQSRLHDPRIASRIHSISGGNLGDLHRLLVACASEAIRTEQEHITLDILDRNQWIRPTRGIREIEL